MENEIIHVLVIDDNPEEVSQLQHLLSLSEDIEANSVASINKAISQLKTETVDVVLLQLTAGLENIKKIRLIKADIPIIVLGWINDETSIEEILKSGANDYLLEHELTENQVRRAIRFTLARHKGQSEPLSWTTALVNKLHMMEALYKIVSQNVLEIDQQIHEILKTGCEVFGESTAQLSRFDGDRYIVEHAYSTTGKSKTGQPIDLRQSYCAITSQTDKPIVIDAERNPKWKNHPGFLNSKKTSYIGIKVFQDDKPYGTLSFSSPDAKKSAFIDSDLEFMKTLGQWIRNILSHTRTSIDADLLDMHDPITGLSNRQSFTEDLSSCINRASKTSYYSFAVLFLEVSNMHRINTLLDKKQSDNFLKLIGKRLKSQLRPRDTIARFSETTFVVLLEDVYINETSFAAGWTW